MITAAEMELIATYELAKGTSKHVPDMKGFDSFLVRQMNPKERRLIARYDKVRNKVIDDTIKLMEADGWDEKTRKIKP